MPPSPPQSHAHTHTNTTEANPLDFLLSTSKDTSYISLLSTHLVDGILGFSSLFSSISNPLSSTVLSESRAGAESGLRTESEALSPHEHEHENEPELPHIITEYIPQLLYYILPLLSMTNYATLGQEYRGLVPTHVHSTSNGVVDKLKGFVNLFLHGDDDGDGGGGLNEDSRASEFLIAAANDEIEESSTDVYSNLYKKMKYAASGASFIPLPSLSSSSSSILLDIGSTPLTASSITTTTRLKARLVTLLTIHYILPLILSGLIVVLNRLESPHTNISASNNTSRIRGSAVGGDNENQTGSERLLRARRIREEMIRRGLNLGLNLGPSTSSVNDGVNANAATDTNDRDRDAMQTTDLSQKRKILIYICNLFPIVSSDDVNSLTSPNNSSNTAAAQVPSTALQSQSPNNTTTIQAHPNPLSLLLPSTNLSVTISSVLIDITKILFYRGYGMEFYSVGNFLSGIGYSTSNPTEKTAAGAAAAATTTTSTSPSPTVDTAPTTTENSTLNTVSTVLTLSVIVELLRNFYEFAVVKMIEHELEFSRVASVGSDELIDVGNVDVDGDGVDGDVDEVDNRVPSLITSTETPKHRFLEMLNPNPSSASGNPSRTCGICLETLINPSVLIGCGHLFCWECVCVWIGDGFNSASASSGPSTNSGVNSSGNVINNNNNSSNNNKKGQGHNYCPICRQSNITTSDVLLLECY